MSNRINTIFWGAFRGKFIGVGFFNPDQATRFGASAAALRSASLRNTVLFSLAIHAIVPELHWAQQYQNEDECCQSRRARPLKFQGGLEDPSALLPIPHCVHLVCP